MINIVVFASGSGTNFQAIIDAVENNQINGRIQGLVSNRPFIQAIERAKKHNISHKVLSPSNSSDYNQYTEALLNQLEQWDTDLIVLAGYMIKIPTAVIERYEERIINIHPSLLPKYGGKGFYGMKVHRAVIDNEDAESGCTVHIVTEKYDDGPILAQRKVPVKKDDDAQSLAARILKHEHELFPEVIAKMADEIIATTNK